MNIHQVFGLGIEMYRVYSEEVKLNTQTVTQLGPNDGPIRVIERCNPGILQKYRDAYTFYDAFERSGHSYIAAYLTRSDYTKADTAFTRALFMASKNHDLSEEDQYASFVKALDISFFESLLHSKSPFLLGETDHPSLADPALRPPSFSQANDLMPYSFFIEIVTCKEMKVLSVLLLVVGLLALITGVGSFLGVGIAHTALKTVGISAMAATIKGGITAAIGSAILFYKPKPNERTLSAMSVALEPLPPKLIIATERIASPDESPRYEADSCKTISSGVLTF